jgi:thiosulfate dehydrogenase (quinone) large subunit
MPPPTPSPSAGSAVPADLSGFFAYLLLRLWLGLRALYAGVEKYAGTTTVREPLLDEFGEPDMSGAMIEVSRKVYGLAHYQGVPPPLAAKFAAEPLLPAWALAIYEAVLGPLLVLIGLTLLVGLASRITLLLHGLVYCSLTVGLILLNESGGVAWLGIHLLLVVAALRLLAHNRFTLCRHW